MQAQLQNLLASKPLDSPQQLTFLNLLQLSFTIGYCWCIWMHRFEDDSDV